VGTSAARKAPVGKFWRAAKTAASRFASGASPPRVGEVVARYLTAIECHDTEGIWEEPVLLPDVVETATCLGNFYRQWEQEGWEAAIESLGLSPTAYLTREEVIPALLDKLAGPGSRLNQAVARSALIDHLGRDFLTQNQTPLTGAALRPERPEPWSEVQNFLGLALYWQFLSDLGESLEFHAPTMGLGFQRQEEVKSYILAAMKTLETGGAPVGAFSSGWIVTSLEQIISILVDRHER
jgi:hypothetical protein